MCNPVIATAMSVAGGVYSGITGMQAAREQANAARMQSEYQAQALEFNAAQARNEADAVSRQGANEVSDLQKRQRAVAASGRAAAGASGLLVDSGSAADVNAATEVQAESDRNLMRENYQRRRFGYINQAAGYEHQAAGARRGGEAYASAAENGDCVEQVGRPDWLDEAEEGRQARRGLARRRQRAALLRRRIRYESGWTA